MKRMIYAVMLLFLVSFVSGLPVFYSLEELDDYYTHDIPDKHLRLRVSYGFCCGSMLPTINEGHKITSYTNIEKEEIKVYDIVGFRNERTMINGYKKGFVMHRVMSIEEDEYMEIIMKRLITSMFISKILNTKL